jgi:hypothetical protein
MIMAKILRAAPPSYPLAGAGAAPRVGCRGCAARMARRTPSCGAAGPPLFCARRALRMLPMHGHSLTFLLTVGGFLVGLLALIFQILSYRRGK